MRKVVRRVGVLSLGKIAGLLYAAMGFLVGLIVAGISMLGGLASLAHNEAAGALGLFFGVGAIVTLPIFYGCLGAIMAMLMGFLYNLLAGAVGGVELEVD